MPYPCEHNCHTPESRHLDDAPANSTDSTKLNSGASQHMLILDLPIRLKGGRTVLGISDSHVSNKLFLKRRERRGQGQCNRLLLPLLCDPRARCLSNVFSRAANSNQCQEGNAATQRCRGTKELTFHAFPLRLCTFATLLRRCVPFCRISTSVCLFWAQQHESLGRKPRMTDRTGICNVMTTSDLFTATGIRSPQSLAQWHCYPIPRVPSQLRAPAVFDVFLSAAAPRLPREPTATLTGHPSDAATA